MSLTNKNNLSLPLAVLIAHNTYDGSNDPKTLSATELLNPVRSIIIGLQHADEEKDVDLINLVASSMGTALHDRAESGWLNRSTLERAMRTLNIPEDVIKRVVVNPPHVIGTMIPIYVERRSSRQLMGWTIRGKFDTCIDGQLSDYKSCSVWKTILDRDDGKDWKLQGSIYKWLNEDIITGNKVSIELIYTDWSSSSARQDSSYPQQRVESKEYALMGVNETEHWIKNKIQQIEAGLKVKQSDMIRCDEKELWATDDVWKYYKKLGAKRATKNYTVKSEAYNRLSTDGGEVKHFPGEIKRCNYCNAVEVCEQAQEYIQSGRLKV